MCIDLDSSGRAHRKRKVEVSVKDPSRDKLMGMRQVVKAKHVPEVKIKARLVILGYQAGDLEAELLKGATPTTKRRAKHCLLQVAIHQGREQQADRYFVQGTS